MAENPQPPYLDRMELERQLGGYSSQTPPSSSLPNVPFKGLQTPSPAPSNTSLIPESSVAALENAIFSQRPDGRMKGGGIPRSLNEMTNPRYNSYVPGDYDNEDAYAQGQGWTEKMINGVGKGLVLTGTTFLQSTVGLANGLVNWIGDGKFSSFYNNEFNKGLDNINKELDNNLLPNYETNIEKNAKWYSPDNLFTANFLWNGIVKNMGFAAGAALSGGVYAAGIKALSSLPGISRLVSLGKQAEVLAATEQGLLATDKVANTYGKIKSLSDRFLSSYNVLNPGGRAVVAGLSTTGEAGFEAYQVLNDFRESKIREYSDRNNGALPTGAELDKINRDAEAAGNAAFLANVGLLTATNYIQFPKILGSSYTAEKGMINSLSRETKEIVEEAGKYIAKPSRGGKILGTLNKIRPYTFSASEAFEEGAQFAVSKGVEDYYNKKYNNDPTDWLKSLSVGIGETLGTDEGMENVLIGGLSGALMQAKGRFTEDRERTRNTADAIQQFNKFRLSDFMKDTIDSVNRGTVLQQEREELLKKGDVLNSKDKEMDYIINYLSPRIKYGRYDLVYAEIADYKKMALSDEGFSQLVADGKALPTDTRQAYLERLNKLEQTADNVKSLYQSLNLRYGGIVDDKGKLVYTSDVMDKMVYAASKVADYDVRIPSLSPKLLKASVNVDQVVKDIVDGKVDSFNEAIDAIKNITTITEDDKTNMAEALEDVAEMSIRRDFFLKEYDKIKNSPKEYQEKIVSQEESVSTPSSAEKPEMVTIKTKTGEKEYEIGQKYFVGKGVDYEKEGLDAPVNVYELTILGENEDGTIRIRDNKGEERNISKEVLQDYKLSKESTLFSDKTARYFYNHRNEIFQFNFGKQFGGKKRGRLEYDNGKLFFVYLDDKGKIKRKEVDNSHFIAQEGYKDARIKKVGIIESKEQKEAKEEFTSPEEARMFADEKLLASALGTADTSVQTAEFNKEYEPSARKSDEIIPRATIGIVRGKPHQIRANTFGFNLNRFDNRKNIRGVYVTSKNEDEILPGLTDLLRTDEAGLIDEDINKDEIIALVMVEEDDEGNVKLVGQDGKPIPEEANALDFAIFQVFPDGNLQWGAEFNNQSMFRKETPQEVRDAVTKQYKEWRSSVIDNPNLSERHEIEASFGRMENVTDADGKIIYETKTSVQDANLISEDDLESKTLIRIPTLPTEGNNIAVEEQGTVKFRAAVGTPILETPNGLVKLQNKKHSVKEAETIYQAILQLAKYMLDPQVGIKDAKSERLLNWLKSTVYWGIPEDQNKKRKPAGYNSVFFEKDPQTNKFMLTLSGKGKDFVFTPTALDENKDAIVLMLSNMYNNINNSFAKQLNEPYEEILSISEDGEITSRLWKNYQSYLLSNKTPDGSTRSGEQLPLSTTARPVANKEDINRTNIYFYTTDTADDFVIPVVEKKKAITPKVLTPGAPVSKAKEETPVSDVITEDVYNNFVDKNVVPDNILNSIADKVIARTPLSNRETAIFSGKTSEINDIIRKKAPVAAAPAPTVTYVLDGRTPETYISPEGRKIIFIAPSTTTAENALTEIKILKGGDLDEVVAKIKAAGKDPATILKKTVFNAIAPTLNEMNAMEAEFSITVPDDVEEIVVADAESKIGKPISQSVLDAVNRKISGLSDEALRVVIERELKSFVPENWNQVEAWLKTKFPNVPVYRVKNIIQATNGRQAWGMFKDGAIYIYENAEVGTVYHEVFHAVWRMFSDPAEQKAVLDEMRSRSGKFYDRASMKDVSYSEATEEQLEEKLAEEFRDYVQFKKIPAKPAKGRPFILKLFADMVTAIKEFFLGPTSDSKVADMFKKIGEGYYKSHIPFQKNLSFAKQGVIDIEDAFADQDAVLSLVGISDRERSDIIQHMTYLTLTDMIKTDESLFNIEKKNKKEQYAKLKNQILETISQKIRMAQSLVSEGTFTQEEVNPLISSTLQLMQNVEDQWATITERHEEYLKSYSIEFDENDQFTLRDENNSGRETYQDATKIDNFKKANSAVKLLLATIPQVDDAGKLVPSSIGGAQLLPVSKTYISLMNNLHTSASVEEMLGSLRKMAVSDPNYRTLYKRITKRDWKDGGVDLSKVDTQHGLQLVSSIWNTFKKQKPDVRNVFILENGEVVVGEANLASAAQQLRSEYINSIVFKAKEGKGFFTYDAKEKVFKGDPSKLKGVNLNSVTAMVDFLNQMGIPFTVSDVNKMTPEKYKVFKGAVLGIKESISKTEKIATFSGKALGMSGRLLELGLVKSAISNPEFSSTYFNVSGERTQSFIGTNAASDLYEFLSKLERFNKESVGGTRYSYLLTDSFAKGSNLLSRMFTENGVRKEDTKDLFEIGYAGGVVNEQKGKRKESSKLTYKDRLIQELNLNLSGYYLNLVPGDASIESKIKMGNAISTASITRGMGDINAIFKEYFKAELELVREGRPVAKGRKSNEMRFFRDILGDELHSNVVNAKGSVEEVYKQFENKINGKIADFMQKDMIKLKNSLKNYGILYEGVLGFEFENVNLPKNINDKEVDKQLMALTANYMIANIEMHKLLYSDPYQYEDELKRIKSFNSPRQAIINSSPKMNTALSNVWNKGYKPGDIGFTKFTQDYFRSATHADVIGIIDLPNYTKFKETDGSGIISMKANRQFRIRAGNWNSDEESQYRYDIAWEKRDKNLPLSKEEVSILEDGNPGIQSAYTPLKPIVSGSKLAKNGTPSSYNNVVLDKFALYPLSYRIMKELDKDANAIKLYDKMQREDIDYVVFTSGRKVGAESPHETYKDGVFNDDPYKAVINVPFSIMSVQSEVPSKEDNLVTRGSQITKLITLDFMEAGVPVDFFAGQPFANRYKAWYKLSEAEKTEKSELYKEIKNNQDLLEALIEEGYKTTLDRLGIKETVGKNGKKTFELIDLSKSAQTLRDEILKREVNDNISSALAGFLQGKVVLEATPAYQQIRNIIYSIADKQFISPKISGGMKVQIPSTLLESGVRNVKDGLYESDVLDFYVKDGKRVAEVMLGRWFDSPLSDEELLKYLNETEEGQKILSGVGYRIPTQKQNSVDVIVIKKFLPKEFRDSVVIPAALVQKVGSDFDIDKLSVYLKNVYVKDGKPKLVPYFGIGEQAINKFKDLFDKGEFLTEEEMKELNRYIAEENILLQDVAEESASGKLMSSIVGKLFSEEELTQEFTRGIRSKDQIISRLYKKSLENEYIQSMENLITHPKNYDNLIKPNSAEQLKSLSNFIAEKTVGSTFDYKNVSNMLDRTFMSRLRHAFVTGKYAIGIAAVNQTNHSLNQRQPIYIDKSRLNLVSDEDKFWLDNADIKFDKYNAIKIDGKMMPTLSMITNKAGEYISDIIGMFIDGYVDISKGPWIMELGATPNVASTWLFLIKLGVPVNTVAYFMNQPIIRDYLRTIESAGYSWLFIDTFVDEMAAIYEQDMSEAELKNRMASFKIPGEGILKNNVGKRPSELSSQEKMDQYLMLKEFLKYAKMAEHMFHVTQGSNYDTSTFNDPYLVFKKQMQQIKAQNTIISSVDTLLANSFIGKLAETVNNIRDAFAQIIKSDSPKVRNVIQKVLLPYVENSDRDFVKIAQKAVSDLFDWAVQTDQNLNEMIKDILVNDGGVGKEVAMFVNSVKAKGAQHPLYNNHVINIIEGIPSIKAAGGGANNAKLNMAENKVYDQNNVIYGFRELRDYLKGEKNPLYERIKLLAVLQSGLSTSPISFTSLLPYEDFEDIYNKTLSKLEGIPNLNDFYELGVFQRNNWNNDDVVPYLKAALITTASGRKHYNPSMKFLPDAVKQAMASNQIPPILTHSKRNREANSDYIVYTWEKQEELLSKDEMDALMIQGGSVYKAIASKKAAMRQAGDYSFINKGLFKKVYDDYGTALEHINYKGQKYFVYKAINAWGDSFRANEFWATDHKSVLENGFLKVEDVDNNVIISKFIEQGKVKTTPTAPIQAPVSNIEVVPRYTDAEVKANRNKVYVFGDNVQRVGTGGQAQIRNNPNAMGIATKLAPSTDSSAYMTDGDLVKNKSIIDSDIAKIKAAGKTVVLPKDGLGTGLAKLKEKAPQTYAYLKQRLLEEFSFNNDTGEISKPFIAPVSTPVTEPFLTKQEEDVSNTDGFKKYYVTAPPWMTKKEAIEYYLKCK